MIIPPVSQVVPLLLQYRYRLILPISIVEGPILTIICGFLMRLGYFHFWPLYLIVIFGDLIGDMFWYIVGRYGVSKAMPRYGRFVGLDKATAAKIAEKFRRNQNKTLLISKMTSGFGFAAVTLTTAGTVKVPLKNFVVMNVIGGAYWSGILIVVGYLVGHLYDRIDAGFRTATLVVVSLIIIAALYGFHRYMRSRMANQP